MFGGCSILPVGRRARLSAAACLLAAACSRNAPPVTYPVPPGVSASYRGTQLRASEDYAKMFCSVLAERSFAAGNWASCDKYVLMPHQQPASVPLDEIPTRWTLLLLGGFGAECLKDTVTAFSDAAEHLDQIHRVRSVRVPVSAFGSSEDNATEILKFMREPAQAGKEFIVVAHSKGAADMMVALENYPQELASIKALVTIAGAIGGSWLVDDFRDTQRPHREATRAAGLSAATDSRGRQRRGQHAPRRYARSSWRGPLSRSPRIRSRPRRRRPECRARCGRSGVGFCRTDSSRTATSWNARPSCPGACSSGAHLATTGPWPCRSRATSRTTS